MRARRRKGKQEEGSLSRLPEATVLINSPGDERRGAACEGDGRPKERRQGERATNKRGPARRRGSPLQAGEVCVRACVALRCVCGW